MFSIDKEIYIIHTVINRSKLRTSNFPTTIKIKVETCAALSFWLSLTHINTILLGNKMCGEIQVFLDQAWNSAILKVGNILSYKQDRMLVFCDLLVICTGSRGSENFR